MDTKKPENVSEIEEFDISHEEMSEFLRFLMGEERDLRYGAKAALRCNDFLAWGRMTYRAQAYNQAMRDIHTMEGPRDRDEIREL